MRTYYIVEFTERSGKHWEAYKRNIITALNIFVMLGYVSGTYSTTSADLCEELLRRKVENPRVVRVIKF